MRTILRRLLVKVSIPRPDDVEDQLARRHSHRPPRTASAELTIGLPLAGNFHTAGINEGYLERWPRQRFGAMGAWNPQSWLVYRPPAWTPKPILSAGSLVRATGFQDKELYQISTSHASLVPELPALFYDRIPLSLCVHPLLECPYIPIKIIPVLLCFLSNIRLSSLSYLCD